MVSIDPNLSTGLVGLDKIMRGLMPGDNLVWQIEYIEDYLPFVQAACKHAISRRQPILYFHFAKHRSLIEQQEGVSIKLLHENTDFSSFIKEVHKAINASRHRALYIFDCLSDLIVDWCSDRMLGNFFKLTCPYLYDVGAIAYFALMRDHHSFHATRPIRETTQVLIDVYRHHGKLYVHPLKVQHRNSASMYMLHAWQDDEFVPVAESMTTAQILHKTSWNRLDIANYNLGYWSSTFARAEALQAAADRGEPRPDDYEVFVEHLRRIMLSQDERILNLARYYLNLRDILSIRQRMIGTGLIGGKSVGMLLARAILHKANPRWQNILEPHDSFFVGSDVFCTYLVQNNCWWTKEQQRESESYLDCAIQARQQLLTGSFPDYLLQQFEGMLDYFGQSPIIVRSSSILEDAFGTAFAGKYDSIFLANQGPPGKRLEDFLSAVRTVYASVMSEDALVYRAAHGLLTRDEQMALLVQRVSGVTYGTRFFPQAAGVALSYNPFVWGKNIEPTAGMTRLVFGLGTRAVERHDDDYTRIVALNAPDRRPEIDADTIREYAQHRVDYLDLEANQHVSAEFEEVIKGTKQLPIDIFASRDIAMENRARQHGITDVFSWVLTFDHLLKQTDFISNLQSILKTLEHAYNQPVDVEYTLNFFDRTTYFINVVQCRPLQAMNKIETVIVPEDFSGGNTILVTHGPVIGQSRSIAIDLLVYVVPETYSKLAVYDRYSVARTIGKLTRLPEIQHKTIMLIGPGRWGSTSPALGVPISFADISSVNVICEIVAMHDSLVPDVSLGTHFFNELVEMEILYCAIFPDKPKNHINTPLLEQHKNMLTTFIPDAAEWCKAIRVLTFPGVFSENHLQLHADVMTQRVICQLQ